MNVFNSGEDAMRVKIWIQVHHRVTGKLLADITELREEPLAKDNRWRLTVNVPGPRVPPHDIRARISAFAERVDGRYAEWHFDLDESFQSRLDFASVVSTAAAF